MKKICLHYALSASSAKDGCTSSSRTPIYSGECFTSLIPPPVYFFIDACFSSAKLSRFCPRYLTQANQHLTSWAYFPFNLFSTTFLDWGNSSNGICKKVVSYFLSKIFQKAFYKPWRRKEIADGDIFHSWLTTIYKHTVIININMFMININTIFSQLKYALHNTQGTAVFSLFADF